METLDLSAIYESYDEERFIDLRSSGAINPRGGAVAQDKRRPGRDRTVEADYNWLRWVFNWAVKWRTPSGHYLMRGNPVRGFEAPREKNPKRPVATHDRFLAIRKISDEVMMESRWGKREEVRSYLSEFLDIVNGTGRRIPQEGSLWQAYRRKWATERKHMADADVAAAGGWKTLQTLREAYQLADEEIMFRVVTGAKELREVR